MKQAIRMSPRACGHMRAYKEVAHADTVLLVLAYAVLFHLSARVECALRIE